jgi:HlyD family secretion protein
MQHQRLILGFLAAAGLAVAIALVLRPPPIDVEVATARSGPMQVTVNDQGETRSHDRFTITAPVSGRLMRIDLHDGDPVSENQALARIAPLPLSEREFDELTARVDAARSALREAQQQARLLQETLAQATREHTRASKLVEQGFIAPQAAEQSSSTEASAAFAAEAARFRSESAAAELKVAEAGLSAVRPSGPLKIIEVKAPMTAHVLRIPDASERVVAAGTPLLVLGQVDRLEIVLEVLSSEAVKVRAGMPVLIDGWGGEKTLRAQVRLVEPYAVTKVSALGVEEKRTNVVADFVDSPVPLGDGFRVTGHVVVWEATNALQMPSSAVFRCGGRWCAFTVEEGRARRRTILPGHRNDSDVEIVEGVSSGAVVIQYPPNALGDGARVRVVGSTAE